MHADDGFPLIVSVDDHVLEPPDLWTARLPKRYREQGPRVIRSVDPPLDARVEAPPVARQDASAL